MDTRLILIGFAVNLIVSLLALGGVGMNILANRRKTDSESGNLDANAGQAISEASLALLKPMQDRMKELSTTVTDQGVRLTSQSQRIADLEHGIMVRDAELEGLRAGVVVLTSQLKRLGIVPEYLPPPPSKAGTGPLYNKGD